MSCTTLYLHRSAEGPWLVGARKYGSTSAQGPEPVRKLCRHEARQSLADGDEPKIASSHCRGLLLDERARVFRIYHCYGDPLVLLRAEAASRRCRTDAAWAGWDAEYAFGGPAELATFVGLGSDALEDSGATTLDDRIAPALPNWQWDPSARIAIYSEDEPWAGEWMDTVSLLSVVDPDGRVRDHAFRSEQLVGLLRVGPALLDSLEPHPPALPIEERTLRAGVTIDRSARTIDYWGPPRLPRRALRDLAASWSGWTVARERDLYLGQLARTGRSGRGLRWEDLDPDALTKHMTPEERRWIGRPGDGPPAMDRKPAAIRFAG